MSQEISYPLRAPIAPNGRSPRQAAARRMTSTWMSPLLLVRHAALPASAVRVLSSPSILQVFAQADELRREMESMSAELTDAIHEAIGVIYVKSGQSEGFSRIGEKERFVMCALDGATSVDRVAQMYQGRFGAPIARQALDRLIASFSRRGWVDDGVSAKAGATTRRPRIQVRRSGEFYLRLTDPMGLLQMLARLIAPVPDRALALLVSLLVLFVETYVVLKLGLLTRSVANVFADPAGVLISWFVAASYASIVFHELAHGVICVRNGGSVHDMGVMFRYLMIFPYCKLDELVLMPSAAARVATIVAGVASNLLLLVPVALLHMRAPQTSALAHWCSLMLVVYNAGILCNLLPLLRMDGYLLVSVGLGRPELKEEAFAAVRALARGTGPRQPVLVFYGLLYLVLMVLAVAWSLAQWTRWFVDLAPLGKLLASAAVLSLVVVYILRRDRKVGARKELT